MRRNVSVYVTLILCVNLLTGCWDRKEINDIAFVTATGFDKRGDNEYQVSVQVPLPGSMGGSGSTGGGGGTGGDKPFYVDSGVGRNIRESNAKLQTRMSRALYFAHRRVLIIGESLAKEGFEKSLNIIALQPQSRLSSYILISKGDAVNVLSVPTSLEKIPTEVIREMTKAQFGTTIKETIIDIRREGIDPIIPVVELTPLEAGKDEKKKQEPALQRVAIVKDDKLVFMTNEEETTGVAWMSKKMKKKELTFPVKKNEELSVRIIQQNLKWSHKVKGDFPEFTIHLKTVGFLEENEPNFILEDRKVYKEVKSKMEAAIEKQITGIIEHSKSKGVDSFGLGFYLYRTEHHLWENKWKKKWREMLPEVKVNVQVNADIQRISNTGLNFEG